MVLTKTFIRGQTVKFEIYDSLFKDIIIGTGILTNNIYGALWRIKPNAHERLSGGEVTVHENFIQTEDLLK